MVNSELDYSTIKIWAVGGLKGCGSGVGEGVWGMAEAQSLPALPRLSGNAKGFDLRGCSAKLSAKAMAERTHAALLSLPTDRWTSMSK